MPPPTSLHISYFHTQGCHLLQNYSSSITNMVHINVTNNNSRKRKSIRVPKSEVTTSTQLPPQKIPTPFSFTSLLIHGNGNEDPFSNIEQQTHKIIETQSENLRRTLVELYRKHYSALVLAEEEEQAAKRLTQIEAELEKAARNNAELKEKEAHFRREAEVWEGRVRRMEEEMRSLREGFKVRGGSLGCAQAQVEGEASSSSSSPSFVEKGLGVACRGCGKRMATMMAWPCRHVSSCVRCDAGTKICRVCLCPKITGIQIFLP